MQVFHCDDRALPLPATHSFPAGKYRALRERLVAERVVSAEELRSAEPAPLQALEAVHAPEYVRAFVAGRLEPAAVRRLGFPWSPELVQRALASVGGTLQALAAAFDDGVAGNLAGGTHHAHRDFGAGYCAFNDLAVAAVAALDTGRARRVLVLDLDVHHGDGTAAIFAEDERVFTCSLHGARNFPARKPEGDLDVALPDGTGDEEYLAALERALDESFDRAAPELVLYQAGVDALAEDRLGRLALTLAGLAERDARVVTRCARAGLPLVATLGGGYATPIELTVEAHVGTYRALRRYAGEARPPGSR